MKDRLNTAVERAVVESRSLDAAADRRIRLAVTDSLPGFVEARRMSWRRHSCPVVAEEQRLACAGVH